MIRIPRCSHCSDTKMVLNNDENAYCACPYCNRKELNSELQESCILDYKVGEDDEEVITRELEDLGIIDEETGESIVKNKIDLKHEMEAEKWLVRRVEEQDDNKDRDRFFD